MRKSTPIWLTIAIALIAFVAGFIIDRHVLNSAERPDGDDPKVKAILDLVAQEYVDDVDLDSLMERNIPLILRGLDPHTSYFEPQYSRITKDHPDGVIPDIGIVLINFNDTMDKVANNTATESEKNAAMDYLDEIQKRRSGGDS